MYLQHCRENLRSSAPAREMGSYLVLATLLLTVVSGLVLTTMAVVDARVKDVRGSRNLVIAKQAAMSGVHRAVADFKQARDYATLLSAFNGIDAMDSNVSTGIPNYTQRYDTEALNDFTGQRVAEYDVLIDVQDRDQLTQRTIAVTCYAYVPSKATFASGATDAARADAHATVTVSLTGAAVFDYSYFINHWGWFFGNNIVSSGSVRSNGQFDFGHYASTINGSPRYLASVGSNLVGYQDDNNDGLLDGNDGGAYSGMKIVNDDKIKGMGALPENQHEYQGAVPMPNLSDLGIYETKALSSGATLKQGGTTYVAGVLGDDSSEKQNLYLNGTAAAPIVINGPVVVRGSVIISGVVSGQGAIYCGGNVYIAKNVSYLNAPATPRPASNDQATVEAWRAANSSKDSLGLFAREHIVLGNYTDSSWQSNVKSWINNSNNKSSEDAGFDGVQNTKAGKDGILGTADDDVLEGDGTWTVTKYTSEDAASGLIPPGKSVGDVVPGSGEDIDGDGSFDDTIAMSQFNIPASLSTTNWAGNLTGTPTFASISSVNINHIDAIMYTNHALAGMIASSSGDITINGAIVSRNESIIYSVPSGKNIVFNHDERLSGRGGEVFGFYCPLTWEPIDIRDWEFEKYMSGVTCPSDIVAYYRG